MSRKLQLWTNLTGLDRGNPRQFIDRARMLEADGWDGATLPDSNFQNPELYVVLGAAAMETSKLRLGSGVTNPATRHPGVTASAMLTLNTLSNGRAVIGIGRGDSPLAYIGGSPVSVKNFETSLEMIRTYLRGEVVRMDIAASALARNSKEGFGPDLAMDHAPDGSLIKWVTDDHVAPPIDIFATGPKVIQVAARQGDYITFAFGADAKRLEWAMGVAKEEMERIGRDPATVSFGAHIPCFPHRDTAISRKLAEGYITAQARFGVMTKKVTGPATEEQRANFERLAQNYDMTNHGSEGSAQANALDDDFIKSFGLTGDPEPAVDRLQEIVALGFDRLQLVTSQTQTPEGKESYRLTVDTIMAGMRAG